MNWHCIYSQGKEPGALLSVAYMICDQQCFAVWEVTDWHKLMVLPCIIQLFPLPVLTGVGPAVQLADIQLPQSATLGLHPVGKLLLLSLPAKGSGPVKHQTCSLSALSPILYHVSSAFVVFDLCFNGLCNRWYQLLATARMIIQLPLRPSSVKNLIRILSLFRQEMVVAIHRPLKLTADPATVSLSVQLNK